MSNHTNIAFWVHNASGYTKLHLRPGQSLTHTRTWEGATGWHKVNRKWAFDGSLLTEEQYVEGENALGSLSRYLVFAVHYNDAHSVMHDDITLPAWQVLQSVSNLDAAPMYSVAP